MSEKQQFCTFFIDGLLYGIEVEKVQEILRPHAMTRVPLAPPVVMGLINLRGQIVTAIDLRRRLGRKERSRDERPINLVLRMDTGLIVDDVGDVVEVDNEDFESPPETLQPEFRALIRGAYKGSDRLLLILETENVLKLIPGSENARRSEQNLSAAQLG
jgi:purine-binding chemotaxis protein CheW